MPVIERLHKLAPMVLSASLRTLDQATSLRFRDYQLSGPMI